MTQIVEKVIIILASEKKHKKCFEKFPVLEA